MKLAKLVYYFFIIHIRPNLQSNFCIHRHLEHFQKILCISKLFGSRDEGIEILTMICVQIWQFLANLENWTNVYVCCSCKLIINYECLVYIHSLVFPLNTHITKIEQFHTSSGADPENFSRGGPTLSKKKPHYTHLNTSYLIVILWIDNCGSAQIWKITNFFISSNIGDIKLCKFQGGSGSPGPPPSRSAYASWIWSATGPISPSVVLPLFLSFAIQLSALIKQMWIIRFSVGKSVDIQKMEHRQNQREEFGSAIFLIETQILILISMLFAGFFFIL